MNTNQTIDGVPRELRSLIERVTSQELGMSARKDRAEAAHELRALLDAPERPTGVSGETFKEPMRDTSYSVDAIQAAQPRGATGEVIAFGIQVEKLLCDALGREWSASGISIESLVAELKGKPQGEPVAWVECSPAWLKAGGDCATAPRLCVGRDGISHLHPAHAEQPAPVAVVLQEDWRDQLFAEMDRRFKLRKHIDNDHMVVDGTKIGVEFACDWVAERLNSTRPAHANPPPGTEPSGTHPHNDGLDEMRKP